MNRSCEFIRINVTDDVSFFRIFFVFENSLPKLLILCNMIEIFHTFEASLCMYLGVEDAPRLQTELLAVVWLIHHLLKSQEPDCTHRPPVPTEDTHLQLSRLSAI